MIRTPVALTDIIARTNKFMLAVQQTKFETVSGSAGSVKGARLRDSGPPAAAAAAAANPPSSAPADGDPPAAETSSALAVAAASTPSSALADSDAPAAETSSAPAAAAASLPSSAPADGDAPVAAAAGNAETVEKCTVHAAVVCAESFDLRRESSFAIHTSLLDF